MEVPQKTKNRAMIQQFYSRVYIQRKQKHQRAMPAPPTPRFTAALFLIAKIWKQHSIQQQKMCNIHEY